jgi:hypothetical protein
MADFHGRANATIQLEYDGVVATGRPHYGERTLDWINRDYRAYRRILLPLADGGAAVAIILNVATFLEADEVAAGPGRVVGDPR